MVEKSGETCPNCNEPVKAHWKICPVCESPLEAVKIECPQCGSEVKSSWKVCPECGNRLICKNCGKRIPRESHKCPVCEQGLLEKKSGSAEYIDPFTGMEFIMIVGGKFMMGDTFGEGLADETPVHEVELSNFFMTKYSVTQGQYIRLIGKNPSKFQKGENYPVEQVSWKDVVLFIRKLNEVNDNAFEFRLPTEAEWEYAARSGGRDEIYAGSRDPAPVAWYWENSKGSTHPVGYRRPNGLGLNDMCGNVWEWCQDNYREDAYQVHPKKNPVWIDNTGDRVIRGGSWNLDAWSVRCARRMKFSPEFFAAGLGFRLVKEI